MKIVPRGTIWEDLTPIGTDERRPQIDADFHGWLELFHVEQFGVQKADSSASLRNGNAWGVQNGNGKGLRDGNGKGLRDGNVWVRKGNGVEQVRVHPR